MTTTPEYDAILARKMREREEGNKGTAVTYGEPSNPDLKMPDKVKEILNEQHLSAISGGYTTKSGRHYKAKPGRKPKEAK